MDTPRNLRHRYVLDDAAVFGAVTGDANRPVGVAQAYTWLKGVVDNLRVRKNLAEVELLPGP